MSIRLTYFAFDGSRGLECRLALSLAGLSFDDHRVRRDAWSALKPTTPFGSLPLLEVDGQVLAQCNAILTWVGRGHDLHPKDLWAAAQHESLMASVEDLRGRIPGGDLDADAQRSAREAFAEGWLAQWADTVSNAIRGPFVDGKQVHVVDIKLYVILRSFITGAYDHLPFSVFDAWPKLGALYHAMDAHPGVRSWFASRPVREP